MKKKDIIGIMPKNRGGLSPRQKAFVEIFCKENGRITPTECARQAGYKEHSATAAASNLRNPKYYPGVVEAIENYKENMLMQLKLILLNILEN